MGGPTGAVTPFSSPLLVLTDRAETRGRPLVEVVAGAVEGGARVVVLREKDLPHEARAALAAELAPLLHAADGLLLAASIPLPGTDGVHLGAADPGPPTRPPRLGRSCHGPAELAAAAREGCDYATLSPVFASATKPGYGPALGVDALRGAPLPAFALGGVDASNAPRCLAAGAAGVAVLGAVMRSVDPAATVRTILEALGAGVPT